MKDNRIVLITGASGFLGTWLAGILHRAGFSLIGIDLRNPYKPSLWDDFATSSCESADWEALVKKRKLFAVLHLAGGASVAASEQDPYADFANLLPGTARLLVFLVKNHPHTRFVFFSSAAVYGNPSSLPIAESAEILPISPYGIHKSVAENLLAHYARISALNIIVLRIFSVYGPGLKKQLIWDVAQKAIESVKNGKKDITLFGTGKETRDFIYVQDICNFVLTTLNISMERSFEIFNVASGEEKTVEAVAATLIKSLDIKLGINFNHQELPGNPLYWRADISKIKKIGFQPGYSFEKGITEVINWIKKDLNVNPENK